jgi:hypothetical protein
MKNKMNNTDIKKTRGKSFRRKSPEFFSLIAKGEKVFVVKG